MKHLLYKVLITVLILVCYCPASYGRGGGGHRGGHSSGSHGRGHAKGVTHTSRYHTSKSYPSVIKEHRSLKASGVARNKRGRIKRSAAAKRAFMRQTGYPDGRTGYVVDHVIALKRGGGDDPSNMQWQTIQDAKAKDKWE